MTARDPKLTVNFIGSYCEYYRDLISEVRSFEDFKVLHLGILSDINRKMLPEIAKIAELDNLQSPFGFSGQMTISETHESLNPYIARISV